MDPEYRQKVVRRADKTQLTNTWDLSYFSNLWLNNCTTKRTQDAIGDEDGNLENALLHSEYLLSCIMDISAPVVPFS